MVTTMEYCTECGILLIDGTFICQQCGTKRGTSYHSKPPAFTDERQLIVHYFGLHYRYDHLIAFLEIYHDIFISKRTLKRRLHSYGLNRRSDNISIAALRQIIETEIQGPAAIKGYRGMWNHLKCTYGITVKRDTVMQLLREMDPEGTELRRTRRLHRRTYSSPGPNHCWHIDGYDKLKPYGLPIHGCVDGFSQKVLWLNIVKSNNNPMYLHIFFWQQ
jgi:hypothetical protein